MYVFPRKEQNVSKRGYKSTTDISVHAVTCSIMHAVLSNDIRMISAFINCIPLHCCKWGIKSFWNKLYSGISYSESPLRVNFLFAVLLKYYFIIHIRRPRMVEWRQITLKIQLNLSLIGVQSWWRYSFKLFQVNVQSNPTSRGPRVVEADIHF